MASRDRSASLPALFIARQQRVEPQIDPELGRAPAKGRRKSRRPSMLDALVPKASIDIPAAYYWPSHDKIQAWLEQWPEWQASPEPPSWFTEEWKGRVLGVVPPGLLPAEVRPRAQSFGRMLSAT